MSIYYLIKSHQCHNLFFMRHQFQARIKTGGAPYSEPLNLIPDRSPSTVPSEISGDPTVSVPVVPTPSPCSSGIYCCSVYFSKFQFRYEDKICQLVIITDSFDLGQILASYGYVPCATFKPGTTVVHITSTVGVTGSRSANHHRLRGSAGLNNSNFRGLFWCLIIYVNRNYSDVKKVILNIMPFLYHFTVSHIFRFQFQSTRWFLI